MALNQEQISVRDAEAPRFDAWYASRGWWARVELEELLYRFQPGADEVFADIGCGTGRLVAEIAPRVKQVIAGDFSPASIAVLEGKLRSAPWGHKVTPMVADMTAPLDISDASIDKIICCQAYQHVPPEGRQNALGELARILKPGGTLFLQVYSFPSWVHSTGTPAEGLTSSNIYFRCWTAPELRDELTGAGWQVRGIYPILCRPQLRRLGRLGSWVEMFLHRGGSERTKRCTYWLIEAGLSAA